MLLISILNLPDYKPIDDSTIDNISIYKSIPANGLLIITINAANLNFKIIINKDQYMIKFILDMNSLAGIY